MIDQRLVSLALKDVDTANFERFAQTFYGALQDREFVPLGGVHDGGAEGFDASTAIDPEVFEETGTSIFLRVSKQKTFRAKIRSTVARLKEFGRNPKVLTYLTSETVSNIDKEEAELSRELRCLIRIRDAKFIEVNINTDPAVQGAFASFLQPSISYAYGPGKSHTADRASLHSDRTLAVFLRQEVDHRAGRSTLLESVSDSLILWSLGDTDPDKGVFLNKAGMLSRIEAALPSARRFIRGVIDHRLSVLTAKAATIYLT